MSVENGEWVLYGLERDDPDCIHDTKELTRYVNKVGFLPLFGNTVPGFSVEEHTVADDWWTGEEDTDPWLWREEIARKGSLIYGKFFSGKAGFISKKWFPVFANFRRDGYDFDARWDDELASIREKKIMDLFETQDELFSFEIRQMAGFHKGGEKGFEGTITALQMQTYLCVREFRCKKNKKGEEYGWPIAIYCTPEHFLGRDLVASCYHETKEESLNRIIAQIEKPCPEATTEQIEKLLGVKKEKKASSKKETDYPDNLIRTLGLEKEFPSNNGHLVLSDDQIKGLSYAISTLKARDRDVVKLRYEEGMTYQAIGSQVGVSGGRIGQIHQAVLKRLRHPSRKPWYTEGLEKHRAFLEKVETAKELYKDGNTEARDFLYSLPLYYCLKHVGICKVFNQCGVYTIGELRHAIMEPDAFAGIKQANISAVQRAIEALQKFLPAEKGELRKRSAELRKKHSSPVNNVIIELLRQKAEEEK